MKLKTPILANDLPEFLADVALRVDVEKDITTTEQLAKYLDALKAEILDYVKGS